MAMSKLVPRITLSFTLALAGTLGGTLAGTLAGTLVVALVVAGCGKHDGAGATMPARPPAMVTAAAAITRDVPVYLDEIGNTVSIESVSIVPRVGGMVVASHVQDGAYVTKDQLLFEIDPRPYEAALASARAQVAQALAEAERARLEFQRVAELLPQRAVSQLEYDQDKADYEAAQARVDAARAAVEQAQLNLDYSRIYAPITGRAGAVLVDPGNVVQANGAAMLVIQQLDPIYAEFTITENDLGTVRKFIATRGLEWGEQPERREGLRVEVDVPGNSQRVLAALGGNTSPSPTTAPTTAPTTTNPSNQSGPREGQLTFLDNAVQQGTGTVRLRATVPNADRYFWPGQFVNVRLVLMTKKNAVLIPAQAQQIGQQGPFVYVVTPDSKAQIRPIVPGQRQGELIVVERGLQAGERVIVKGQMSVMPDGPVVVTNDQPQQGAAHAQAR